MPQATSTNEEHGRLLTEAIATVLDEVPSGTTLYDLPLEIVDIILQKSYMYKTLHSCAKQREKDAFRYLTSVDICFLQRISRQRFQKTVWRRFQEFYGKMKKRWIIIRNNRSYLLKNIQPSEELFESLVSLNCIKEEQSHRIQRMLSDNDKNAELLHVAKSFGKIQFSNFVKCLRKVNQKTVARIMENGGGVLKIDVRSPGKQSTTAEEGRLLHQEVSQLREEGIEILNSQLDRQTVIVWIWCRSQAALETIQRLYYSNQLRDAFFRNIQSPTSMMINIDKNQFTKTFAVCQVSINFTQKIEIKENGLLVQGVTKLDHEIYILCQNNNSNTYHLIRVFEDRNEFRFRKEIKMLDLDDPSDIGSSEMENCLYVSDSEGKCIWKVTREADSEYKAIKWLTTDYEPRTLSVSSDGQLLVNSKESYILRIYGSNANLIRRIQFPEDIGTPVQSLETVSGTLIISHIWPEDGTEVKEDDGQSNGKARLKKRLVVSELNRDGEKVISRFVPSNDRHQLNGHFCLSLSSDDEMVAVDSLNGTVVLLDSYLKWKRTLVPAEEYYEEFSLIPPSRKSFYDEENRQLIVAIHLGVRKGVNVYTLNQN